MTTLLEQQAKLQWEKQRNLPAQKRSIFKIILSIHKNELILGAIFGTLQGILFGAARPLILREFIRLCFNPQVTALAVGGCIVGFALVIAAEGFFHALSKHYLCSRMAVDFMTWSSLLIQTKQQETMTNKKLNDLVTKISDLTNRIVYDCLFFASVFFLISALISNLAVLLYTIGAESTLTGLGIILLLFVISVILLKKYREREVKSDGLTFTRVEVIQQFLTNLISMKMSGLNSFLEERTLRMRTDEKQSILKARLFMTSGMILAKGSIFIATACSLIILASTNQTRLNPDTIFTAITAFQGLRLPFIFLPPVIAMTKMSKELFQCMLDCLHSSVHPPIMNAPPVSNHVLVFKQAVFEINPTPRMWTLGLSVDLSGGQMMCILGPNGSGKTTLLKAMLGEYSLVSGTVYRASRVSYVAQRPFIFKGTVKENILMNLPMEENRFREILEVCRLTKDVNGMEKQLDTNVGERGRLLSGGQKQRVALARALYSRPSLILVDDIFSGLNEQVSTEIIQQLSECIRRERIALVFVSPPIYLIPRFHLVFSMDKDHQIRPMVKTLTNDPTTNVDPLLGKQTSALTLPSKEQVSPVFVEHPPQPLGKLIGIWIRQYLGNMGIGWVLLNLCIGLGAFGVLVLNDLYLVEWIKHSATTLADENVNRAVFYLGLYLAHIALLYWFSCTNAVLSTWSVHRMFTRINDCLYGAKVNELNHRGKILSVLSIDLNIVDYFLMRNFDESCQLVLGLISSICICGILFPITLIPSFLFVSASMGLVILYFPKCTSSKTLFNQSLFQIKGIVLELNEARESRLPTERFMQELREEWRKHAHHRSVNFGTNTSLIFLSGILAGMVTISFTVLVYLYKGTLNPASVGLILIHSLYIPYTGSIFTSYVLNLLEQLISLKEVSSIGDFQQEEEKREKRRRGTLPMSTCDTLAVRVVLGDEEQAMSIGRLDLENVRLRYTDVDVLKGLTLTIRGGMCLGLIGRTGSGKTSLLNVFSRIYPHTGGTILLDGKEIQFIPLEVLRQQKMVILPQEPVVFDGTILENVDPFGDVTEKQVEALGIKFGMKRMDRRIQECSLGEQQLIQFMRVLVNQQVEVIIMDEPFSMVDAETEKLLIHIIQKELAGKTRIIISHKLDVMRICERVITLDQGKFVFS